MGNRKKLLISCGISIILLGALGMTLASCNSDSPKGESSSEVIESTTDTSESGVDNSKKEESQNAAKIAELKTMFNEGYTFNGTEDDLDKAIEKALDKAEPDDYDAQIVYYIVESLKEDGFEVKSINSDETDDETDDSDVIEDVDPTVEHVTTAPSEKETSKTTTTTTARKQDTQTQQTEPVQTQPPAPQTDPPAPPQTDPPAPPSDDGGFGDNRPDWGGADIPEGQDAWGHSSGASSSDSGGFGYGRPDWGGANIPDGQDAWGHSGN